MVAKWGLKRVLINLVSSGHRLFLKQIPKCAFLYLAISKNNSTILILNDSGEIKNFIYSAVSVSAAFFQNYLYFIDSSWKWKVKLLDFEMAIWNSSLFQVFMKVTSLWYTYVTGAIDIMELLENVFEFTFPTNIYEFESSV